MRTDLLAPRTDVGLNQQTTEVTFSEVQLAGATTPLWLPRSVKVYVEFTTHNGDVDEFYELSYRNEHRYTDYQRYRCRRKWFRKRGRSQLSCLAFRQAMPAALTISAASAAPSSGPNIGIGAYAQSEVPFPATGHSACATRGPKSRAGLMA